MQNVVDVGAGSAGTGPSPMRAADAGATASCARKRQRINEVASPLVATVRAGAPVANGATAHASELRRDDHVAARPAVAEASSQTEAVSAAARSEVQIDAGRHVARVDAATQTAANDDSRHQPSTSQRPQQPASAADAARLLFWPVPPASTAGTATGTASAQAGPAVCRCDVSAAALLIDCALLKADNTRPTEKSLRVTYQYGNYHNYYGYRFAKAFDEDPRLQMLRAEWFEQRECLDVGCNEGLVTIAIAAKFKAASMMGLDIDNELITKAIRNLSGQRSSLKTRIAAPDVGAAARRALQKQLACLHAVRFATADFLTMPAPPAAAYDTVLCLSVTKWVHLNWGDAGLATFFERLAAALRPGGFLVLEPQPWKSYQQAKRKQDMMGAPFASLTQLTLRPEQFVEYLEAELGLQLLKHLHCKSTATGFGRPIFILRKA